MSLTAEYSEEIEQLFDRFILSKCKELTKWKFIKLSIHIIKYFHMALFKEKSMFKTTNEPNHDLIIIIDIFAYLYSPIMSL